MKNSWCIADIIDLEHFLHVDRQQEAEHGQSLRERDRKIFLHSVKHGKLAPNKLDRKSVIKLWLDKRREEREAADKVSLPGQVFQELNRFFQLIFTALGIFVGCSIGWSLLSYSGEEPLNVFISFAVFVLSQLVFFLIFFVIGLYRLKDNSSPCSSILYSMLTDFFIKTAFSLKRYAVQHLSVEQRNSVEAAFGVIKNKEQTYGLLFYWPVFIWIQLFAVSLNVGLCAAILFKVITSDVAFGWQSTLQFSPQAVYDIVEIIALPWSWFVSAELAYPSLAQIEGSRIILKEGMYHLATPDLVSWWPFLCFSLVAYGLIPRLMLFVSGVVAQGRCLAHLDFQQSIFEALLMRMQTPLVTSKGQPSSNETVRQPKIFQQEKVQESAHTDYAKIITVLIPDDIFDSCTRADIESLLGQDPACKIADLYRIGVDFQSDQDVFTALQKNTDSVIPQDFILVQEAWQPPLVEHVTLLKELRKAVGKKNRIQVGLIGKPDRNTIFTPVADESWNVWLQKIQAIGDAFLTQVRLVEDAYE